MATQWTPTSAGSAGSTPEPGWEEQAFLVGGRGRAAEVAVVSLVEAGALRISREGLVSAVGRPAHGWSPLQAHVVRSLPRSLGDVITATAQSAEAQSLGQHLVDRGLVTPSVRRQVARRTRQLLIAAAVGAVIATIVLELSPGVTFGAVVAGVVGAWVLRRVGRPLTGAGRQVVQRLKSVAVSPNRIALVAYSRAAGQGRAPPRVGGARHLPGRGGDAAAQAARERVGRRLVVRRRVRQLLQQQLWQQRFRQRWFRQRRLVVRRRRLWWWRRRLTGRPRTTKGRWLVEKLGVGIGWRPEIDLTVERLPGVDFVEVVAENLHVGHLPESVLLLRERGVPVLPHAVSLSLGGAEPVDAGRVAHLGALAEALDAPLVSDHVCFVRAGGLDSGPPHAAAPHP